MKNPSPVTDSAVLSQLICDRIARSPEQRITFAEFMELALYHPEHGYYAGNASQLGFRGDFVTSVHLGNDFGELIAEQLAEIWHKLMCPTPFQLVEMGPGQGHLADIILSYLQTRHPDCLAAVRYTLVEKSAALRTLQHTHLQPWQEQGVLLNWCDLSDIPSESVTGCLFSNELVDALPVHQVTLTEQGLQERYVTAVDDGTQPFDIVTGPLSTAALVAYFEPK